MSYAPRRPTFPADRHTDRHTGRHTDRHTGRHTGRLSLMSATALVGVAASVSFTPALARDDTSEVIASAEGPLVLDTLKVTARRAEESVKDVPFSMSVISGDVVEERGTPDLESTLRNIPGVDLTSFGDNNSGNMKIRGVGSLNRTGADDSSVVLYLDGMPLNLSDMTATMLDMEQIEILKGPQGTLYGRNSEAGAINMVSRKPTDVLEGYLRGEIGTGMQYLTEGAVGGPIVGDLKGRLAFRYSGYDLWVENAQTGDPLSDPETLALRGTLLWEPTERTTLTVVGSHEAITDHASLLVKRPYGEAPVTDVPPDSMDESKWSHRFSAELTHTLPFAVATVFSGYTHADWHYEGPFYEGRLYESLIGMVPESHRWYSSERNAYNQEIRLSSRPEDDIFWVGGVNYFRTDWTFDERDAFDTFYPMNPFNADIDRNFSAESYAIFGEVTVPVTRTLKVTVGARHTWEHKTFDIDWRATDSNPSPLRRVTDKQTLDDDYTTGRLAFGYEVTPDVMVHGAYARGYKSGGWGDFGSNAASGLRDEPYDPAIVDSYELGVRSTWLDGDLSVTGAVFWNTTRDDHLQLFNPTLIATESRNFDTESKGVELDATMRLGHGFTLAGSLSYTDAKITGTPSDLLAEVREGNGVPGVPEWGWSLSLTHDMDLPDFLVFKDPILTSTIRNQYVGARPADPENHFDLDAYNKLDVRLGLSTDNAELYFRADNLLDERYDLYAFHYPAFIPGTSDQSAGGPARGRSFVVGAAYYF